MNSSRLHRRSVLWSVVLLVGLATIGLSAQAARVPRLATCGRDTTGLGRITGQMIADSAGIRLSRGVLVPGCMSQSNDAGSFTIRGLPPGDYPVSIGDLFLAPVAPVVVHVSADSTSTVTFHLRPENSALDCLRIAECTAMIAPSPASVVAALSDSDQVRESAYRTAIMLLGRPGPAWQAPDAQRVFCLAGEKFTNAAPTAVVAAVKARIPSVRPFDGCDIGPLGRPTPVYEAGTKRFASMIVVRLLTMQGATATATMSSTGTTWTCTFTRSAEGWQPTACRTTGVA